MMINSNGAESFTHLRTKGTPFVENVIEFMAGINFLNNCLLLNLKRFKPEISLEQLSKYILALKTMQNYRGLSRSNLDEQLRSYMKSHQKSHIAYGQDI